MSDKESSSLKVEIRAYHRPDGDHPIYAAIGNIAAEWSHLEFVLDEILRMLVPRASNAELACITAQLTGVAPRFRAITSLLSLRSGKTPSPKKIISKLNTIQGRSFDIGERRNRIVHDPWYIDIKDQPAQLRSMPSKDPQYGMSDIDKKFLAETYDKICDLITEAEHIKASVYDALVAWQEIPQSQSAPTQEEMAHSREILKHILDRL